MDLKRKYIDEPAEKMNKKGEDNLSDNNPLALSDNNPWQQYFADTEIRKVIRQDVERTFPDVDFFRSNEVQQQLTDILFIYCKLNKEVSYRQGMHELLAPFFWVVALDSLNSSEYSQDLIDPSTKLMTQVLDAAYVEHDAYILFSRLMIYGKKWYEFNDDIPASRGRGQVKPDILSAGTPKPTESARLNPVVMICHRIHHQYLRSVDPLLYTHLENFGIEPQLYGLRWIRLLFGREFEIHELFKLWDAIFAQDPTLQIVECICLVILLRMRDDLLHKDYAECLSLLMRPTKIAKPTTLVEQAKYLQDNLSEDTALHILQQNDARSGKHPRHSLSDGIEINNHNDRLQTRQERVLHHRRSYGAQLDTSFSQITNGMMKNPQVRHLNKAIAGVMGSVQKNVNTFGENVLGRASSDDPDSPPRRSDFPTNIERIAPAQKQERISAANLISDENGSFVKLKSMNRNMGEVMAKCINILEEEIFSTHSNNRSTSKDPSIFDNEAEFIKNNTSEPLTARETEDDKNMSNMMKEQDMNRNEAIESNAENSKNGGVEEKDGEVDEENMSRASQEQEEGSNTKVEPSQTTEKDEAKIIMALVSLKHVRDVLLGKQDEFDNRLMDTTLGSQPSEVNNKSGEKQETVAHVITPQYIAEKPLPPSLPPSDHHSPPPPRKCSDYDKNKPLPVITQTSYEIPSHPITYVPTNPPPPKQQVKYRIEDLLADPSFKLLGSKSSSSDKFKWMLSSENESNSDAANHSTSVSNISINNANHQDLFKIESPIRPTPRKRRSFIMSRTVPAADTIESTVDPLDAKNVDNKKPFEYDIL
ncbi:hypothetical protein BDB01DRAFT_774606 [Pilobolus umbonatus]|nr:hypothetical protein BDB01DRAFT_774606 [Pilobolus umbonatus]